MSFKPATIEMIKVVAEALGELNERAVFVGGAAKARKHTTAFTSN